MMIDAFDYILLPIYVFIFYRIILRIKKKQYPNSIIGKYLVWGFFAKIIGGLLFGLIYQYYYGDGDTFMYFTGGLNFKKTILQNFPANIRFLYSPAANFGGYYKMNFDNSADYGGYLSAGSNLMAAKFVAFFPFLLSINIF